MTAGVGHTSTLRLGPAYTIIMNEAQNVNIIVRPRRSRSAAAYSDQTFP